MMNSKMRAIVCRKPHEITSELRPRPVKAASQVLLKISRIGICGTDYHIYEGLHPFLEYPRVMGHELSATVEETDSTSKLTRGQLVVVNPYLACGSCHACKLAKPNCCMKIQVLGVHRDGGMCEYLSLPEENLLPAEGLSADAAASVEFLAIGAHAVRRSGMNPGSRVLVIGAGPIGLGTALFARIAGGQVTIMDRDAARLALASAATGITRNILADEKVQESIAKSTERSGFDVVFDATGNRTSMQNSFDYVAHGGSYVMVGLVKDNITFFDPDFHRREMTLFASRNATTEDFELVISSIVSGKIELSKLITHRTDLAEATVMLPRWANDKNGLIKAMIEIS
jgi:2-desacetyl-2-hydroxyethyl bacteriochlorophyllide A dehydrogenase